MIFPYSCLPSGVGAPCPSWLGICFADILAPPPQVGGGKWCLLYKALPSPTAAARWDQPQKLPWSRYLDPLSFPHIPSSLTAPHWRLSCRKFTRPRPRQRSKSLRILQDLTGLLHLLWRKNSERLRWPFSSLASRLYLRITQKRLHVKFLYEGMTITTSTPHSRLDSWAAPSSPSYQALSPNLECAPHLGVHRKTAL